MMIMGQARLNNQLSVYVVSSLFANCCKGEEGQNNCLNDGINDVNDNGFDVMTKHSVPTTGQTKE